MDFCNKGKASSLNYQHSLLATGRLRPLFKKPQINPITGEEICTTGSREVQKSKEITVDIPSLNLSYLKEDDTETEPMEIDLNGYSLDSPDSASTVSWGTARSSKVTVDPTARNQSSSITLRPDGVPELELYGDKPESSEQQVKQMNIQQDEDTMQTVRRGLGHNEIMINDSWIHHHYTRNQLLKKKDAEDLFEQSKKLKLMEAVMADQLSRATVMEPEQNDQHMKRSHSSQRNRNTSCYVHDSRICTKTTATEKLLSKQIRFDARILTHSGRDAVRELTGFFFDFDKALAVYEFRQFGKSAKAMPFIYRGQYFHTSGPKLGLPYSLLDIYTGGTLKIPTEGQLALTDSLAENSHILLRITEVDESERQAFLAERVSEDERQHTPNTHEVGNRKYMYMIKYDVQRQIHKRGIQTVTGLGRYYRTLDQYNTGMLDQYDLEKGLKTFHINLDQKQLEQIFEILDSGGLKMLDYKDYMCEVIGEMSEPRKAFVRKAFHKLDNGKKGTVHISDVKKFFSVNTRYKPSADGDTLQAFLDAVRESEKQELISYLEFEEYYEGLSLGIDNDEDFANVLRNTWNV